jgi:hypothetical protein
MITEEKKQEGNRLIACFMGWETEAVLSGGHFCYQSWDWLMAVVYKINSGIRLSAEHSSMVKCVTDNKISTDIETMWLLVVEYIEWQNKYLETHECRYCGAETTQNDADCFKNCDDYKTSNT